MEVMQRITDKEIAMYLAGLIESLPENEKYTAAKDLIKQWRNPPILINANFTKQFDPTPGKINLVSKEKL